MILCIFDFKYGYPSATEKVGDSFLKLGEKNTIYMHAVEELDNRKGSEMKRRSRLSISRRHLREEVVKKSREGVFDRNPLLVIPHDLLCKGCGCSQKVTYLYYLRSGRFRLGKTEMVEVDRASLTITGLSRTVEKITPIIIRVRCKGCQTEISFSPVSLEYLLFIARKGEATEEIYI